jgi:hypothetical protein
LYPSFSFNLNPLASLSSEPEQVLSSFPSFSFPPKRPNKAFEAWWMCYNTPGLCTSLPWCNPESRSLERPEQPTLVGTQPQWSCNKSRSSYLPVYVLLGLPVTTRIHLNQGTVDQCVPKQKHSSASILSIKRNRKVVLERSTHLLFTYNRAPRRSSGCRNQTVLI